MHGRRFVKDFRRSAPDHHQARCAARFAEFTDVVHQHLGVLHLGALGFQVGSVDALDVFLIEDGGHGPDSFKRSADLLEQCFFEHASQLRGFVCILLENVPGANHQVLERR